MSLNFTHPMFNIAKNHQPFLYCKDYYQVECHWCSYSYLLWYVFSIHRCTLWDSQVLVLCKWHESLHGGMKHKYAVERSMVPCIWQLQEGTNLSKDKVKSFKERNFVFIKQQFTYFSSKFVRWEKLHFNKLICKCNVMVHNMAWEGCSTHCHLQCQNNITICGFRLMIFLLLDMDESTRFYVVKLQTKGNMKL